MILDCALSIYKYITVTNTINTIYQWDREALIHSIRWYTFHELLITLRQANAGNMKIVLALATIRWLNECLCAFVCQMSKHSFDALWTWSFYYLLLLFYFNYYLGCCYAYYDSVILIFRLCIYTCCYKLHACMPFKFSKNKTKLKSHCSFDYSFATPFFYFILSIFFVFFCRRQPSTIMFIYDISKLVCGFTETLEWVLCISNKFNCVKSMACICCCFFSLFFFASYTFWKIGIMKSNCKLNVKTFFHFFLNNSNLFKYHASISSIDSINYLVLGNVFLFNH